MEEHSICKWLRGLSVELRILGSNPTSIKLLHSFVELQLLSLDGIPKRESRRGKRSWGEK